MHVAHPAGHPPHGRRQGGRAGRSRLPLVLLAGLLGACVAQTAGQPSIEPPAALSAATSAPVTTPPQPTNTTLATGGGDAVDGPVVVTSAPPSSPSPASASTGSASPLRPFSVDLYRSGDFVAQYTDNWCVGASIQMMRNLVRPGVLRSRAEQQALWELARDRSASRFGGANPRGWAAALNELGLGPYELVGIAHYGDALRAAASALRTTGRPVGLVMWAGRHAWVMSGFSSLGDPLLNPDFVLTGVRVLDPLYPHGTAKWGASPTPDSLLRPSRLADAFVPRRGRRQPDYVPPGTYALVLPVSEPSPNGLRDGAAH
jgi:hypothetical protein